MLGRVALLLCLLVAVAQACPIKFKNAEEEARFNGVMAQHLDDQQRLRDASREPQFSFDSREVAIAFALIGLLGLAIYPSRLPR
jgi:hypothetical protein